MAKRKKDEIPLDITTGRSLTIGMGIMFWDQLVKAAEEIVARSNDGIPPYAEVTFQGENICVDWTEGA